MRHRDKAMPHLRIGELPMKTRRLRANIVDYLRENGPMSTTAIKDHLNQRMRHGTTMQQLGNVLAKYKDFKQCGMERVSGILSGGYMVCVWELNEDQPHP